MTSVEKCEVSPGEKQLDEDVVDQAPTVATFPRQLLRERHLGVFARSFAFPVDTHERGLKASLKNGILMVTVPKQMQDGTHGMKIDVDLL